MNLFVQEKKEIFLKKNEVRSKAPLADRNESKNFIERLWNEILPTRACAFAFLNSAELKATRKGLVRLAKLKDESEISLLTDIFNRNLRMEAIINKQYEDWKNHFMNWVRLQDDIEENRNPVRPNKFKRETQYEITKKQIPYYTPYKPHQSRSRRY